MTNRRPRMAVLVALVGVLVMGGIDIPSAGAGALPAPRWCSPRNLVRDNVTDVTIPTVEQVVASTITVSGAGPVLHDLNVRTYIEHPNPSDLDVSLTSPAGSVVTLTTDNGGPEDNVFNGTLWNDQADPAGQVPYTVDNGLVTDRTYVNNQVAIELVPEEALAGFDGENPNGTWTLTIADDNAGSGGTLTGWQVDVSTLARRPLAASSSWAGSGVAVPTGPAVVSSTIDVSGRRGFLDGLAATTALTHSYNLDVDMTLTSPSGTVATLTTDNGGPFGNVFTNTRWADDVDPDGLVPYLSNPGLVTDHPYVSNTPANPLVPEEAMAAFDGENPNGTWTLRISDDNAGDGGNLDGWGLQVRTTSCARPDGRIALGASGPLVGNNRYDAGSPNQTRSGSGPGGGSVVYRISLQNDALVADRLRVSGGASGGPFLVTYRSPSGANITNQVRAGTYRTPPLAPGRTHTLRAVVTVRRNAPQNATLNRTLTVRSTGNPGTRDVVRFVTRRR